MSFQEELVNEINELRTNPKAYAKKVEKYIGYFKGKSLHIPGTKAGLRTEEGPEAYKEAVDFLSKADPVDALEPSKGMGRISKDFFDEVQKVDPQDLGNINWEEIIDRYGSINGTINREVSMGDETPEQIVVSLVVSDGDPSRGHRECLLSTDLKKIGAANGTHKIYRFCTVIFFCTQFKNKVDSNDEGYFDVSSPSETKKEEKEEGQTLKPKKVVLKQQPKEEPKQPPKVEAKHEAKEEEDEGDSEVVSEKRTVKIVEVNGKKKKEIKIIKTLKDGSREVNKIYKEYNEGEDDDDD